MRDDNLGNRTNESGDTQFEEIVTSEYSTLSWGAIFAGVAVAMVIFMLLNLLGIGIGASTLDIQEGDVPSATALGIGAVLWTLLSALIALFAGSWVTGRFTYFTTHALNRALHGVVVWSLVYVLSAVIVTTAMGKVVGGAANLLGKGITAAGQGVAAAGQEAAQQPEQAQNLLQSMGFNPEEIVRNIVPAGAANAPEMTRNLADAAKAFFSDEGNSNQQARNNLVQALVQSGRSPQEANQMVDRWQQNYVQAKEQTKDVAGAVAEGTSKTAFWAFLTMLLGLGVSILGSILGRHPEHEVVTATA